MSTLMQEDDDTGPDNDDGAFNAAISKPNRCHENTGDHIHINFNILKSEQLVSTAVRNNISSTALAAAVHSLVEACINGDPSKLNLHPSQAYR